MKKIISLLVFLLILPVIGVGDVTPYGGGGGEPEDGPGAPGDVTSSGDLAPETRHRVLMIGTNSTVDFPGDGGNGFAGQTAVWLLNKLGFRLTLWETESADVLTLREQSLLGLDVVAPLDTTTYAAIFMLDVSLALHGAGAHGLMRDVQQAAQRDSIPLYCLVQPNSYLGNGGGSLWMDGTVYSEVWQPDDASYPNPITMATFAATDTLRLHGRGGASQLRYQSVRKDSTSAGKTTPLMWKYQTNPSATADTCLMWRYVRTDLTPNMNVVAMQAADTYTGVFFLVSQFIRDMGYAKYADYVPLVYWWMLDADGMESTPYCGPDAARWERIAALTRQIGWTRFYFNIWPDDLTAHCGSFVTAWPEIDDVIDLNLHGVTAALVADHLWTKLAAGEPTSQAAYTTSWITLRAPLTPKPDSTATMTQTHQGEWSLDQARVFARHGNMLLPTTVITPQASAYIQKLGTLKHSRFRPFSPLPTGTARVALPDTIIAIVGASALAAGNYATYDAWYAYHAPGTLQSTVGYYTGNLATSIISGQFMYNHVPTVSGENVVGECYLRAVALPFFKATAELWEFNNSPENIRALAVRIPTRYGM